VDFDDETIDAVEAVRGRLAEPCRRLPTEDLIVCGAMLTAAKPVHAKRRAASASVASFAT
jgi:hypothetical protein